MQWDLDNRFYNLSNINLIRREIKTTKGDEEIIIILKTHEKGNSIWADRELAIVGRKWRIIHELWNLINFDFPPSIYSYRNGDLFDCFKNCRNWKLNAPKFQKLKFYPMHSRAPFDELSYY